MDIKERIDTISDSFKLLPPEEQIALLDRLKKETSAKLLKLVEETEQGLKELRGYCHQLDPIGEAKPISMEKMKSRAIETYA